MGFGGLGFSSLGALGGFRGLAFGNLCALGASGV